jgi:hypothetical protein
MNENGCAEYFLLWCVILFGFFAIAFVVIAEGTAKREVIYDCEQNRKYEIVEYRFHFKDDISHTDIPHEYCIKMQDENQ